MKKILIVDDKTYWQEILATCLQPNPYELFQAHNSLEAIALAKREKPDLILLDSMLESRPNSFELCHLFKADLDTGHAFIIMLVTPSQELSVEGLVAAGADARLARPVDLRMLTTHIDQLQAMLESNLTRS